MGNLTKLESVHFFSKLDLRNRKYAFNWSMRKNRECGWKNWNGSVEIVWEVWRRGKVLVSKELGN